MRRSTQAMRDLLELRPCSVSSVDFEPNPDADSRLRCVAPRTIAGRCEVRTFETAQRKPHQHTSLLLSGSTDTVHSHHARHFTSLGSYLHTSTPPPPINTNTAANHPPATSSSPRDKGPCTSQQLAAEIILGATAEVQLNSATDSTSVLGQAKAYAKTNRTSTCE